MLEKIPPEMLTGNRKPDQTFSDDEKLYIRFNVIAGDKVDVSCIRCPSQSVNRSKYSEPRWVLITPCMKYLKWGYGYFVVNDIPLKLTSPGGVDFFQRVEHVPEESNYSHSEVRTYKEEEFSDPLRRMNNKKTAMEFRLHLRDKIIIIEKGDETRGS